MRKCSYSIGDCIKDLLLRIIQAWPTVLHKSVQPGPVIAALLPDYPRLLMQRCLINRQRHGWKVCQRLSMVSYIALDVLQGRVDDSRGVRWQVRVILHHDGMALSRKSWTKRTFPAILKEISVDLWQVIYCSEISVAASIGIGGPSALA